MRRSVWLAGMLLLAGCAAKPPVVAVAPPPVVRTAMPQPPAGAAASFRLPPRGVDGGWLTPNTGLSAAGTAWHLRAALNVAALGCRDAGEPARVAAYNRLLARHAAAFTAANKALTAEYRAAAGPAWQDAQDDAMTRLYNFWAQPPVHADLCAAADAVLAEAALTADLPGFAAAALPRLEAPFLTFYDRFAAYQVALAAWQGAAPVQLAAAPLPVDPAVFEDVTLARSYP